MTPITPVPGRVVQKPRGETPPEPPPLEKGGQGGFSNPANHQNPPQPPFVKGGEAVHEPVLPATGGRADDSYVGRPVQKLRGVANTRTLSPEAEPQMTEDADDTDVAEKLQRFSSRLSAWLFIPLLLLAALLGLFVFAQTVAIFATLLSLPWWLQVPGWGIFVALSGILGYVVYRLVRVYRRLGAAKQIAMTRVHSGKLSAKAAKARLQAYLQAYDVADADFRRRLQQVGVSAEVLEELGRHREELLSESPLSSEAWLVRCGERLLAPLDAAAAQRAEYYARMTAFKATVSPNALLDTFIVLYNGVRLLTDLCTLYHVRPGKAGMVYLLGLVMAQSYAAGKYEENINAVEHAIAGLFGNSEDHLAELGMAGAGATVAGFFGARTIEAALHYLFMKRIGSTARGLLRPLV